MQARQRLIDEDGGGERIHVYDSHTGAGGMGLVAIGARGRLGSGRRAAVVERAMTRQALRMWFAVETLEYLRRGGRIGVARALLGSTLKIKPILTLDEEITPVDRVRTRKRAFEAGLSAARAVFPTAPMPGSSSTYRIPTRRRASLTSAARSSAPSRSSCRRSVPCSEPMSGPA